MLKLSRYVRIAAVYRDGRGETCAGDGIAP